MEKYVSHKGRIAEITQEFTRVEIVSSSACAQCHAKSLCELSEFETKIIEVPTDGFAQRQVGDEVEVMMKRSMGLKAVWICYVIPLAVLMLMILLFSRISDSELVTGSAGISGVGIYYLVIWLFRDRLSQDCVFYIK